MSQGILYLLPTILADGTSEHVITEQEKSIIKSIDYFLVENVRTSRRFISSLKLGITIAELRFEELSKKTPEQEVEQLCKPLLQHKNMGILSEAGCPGIADPGQKAVSWAHQHNIKVMPVSGPSSFILALMASGLSGQSFTFHGYLPVDKTKRSKAIQRLDQVVSKSGQTQMFMETPYRNDHLIKDILRNCNPNNSLCIASGLTSESEFIKTQRISMWKKDVPEIGKIPTVFLLGS